jgi:hypothetical protein
MTETGLKYSPVAAANRDNATTEELFVSRVVREALAAG